MMIVDCPICEARDSIKIWRVGSSKEKAVHYYFKCNKCEAEWH